MGRRSRNRNVIVPEAKAALNQFKRDLMAREGMVPKNTQPHEVSYEVAQEIGVPLKHGNNGDITTKSAGEVGGQIGGRMVKELVKMAQEQLAKDMKK